MNKELLKKAFTAGATGGCYGIKFEQWFNEEVATEEFIYAKLRRVYKLCSQKFFGIKIEDLFNSRKAEYSEFRHIVRGIFLEIFASLSYVGLAKMEKGIVKLSSPPNHATIINSKNNYQNYLKNSSNIAHKELILTINNILDE